MRAWPGLAVLLAGAVLAGTPAAARQKKAPPPPTAEESAQLQAIIARGNLLFDLDRAAWVATDDFAAKVGNLATSGGRGYVTEREGEGFVVTFYGGEEGSEVAIYVGHVAGGRVTSGALLTGEDRVPLTPAQKRLAAARRAGYAAGLQRCTAAPFNITAVPTESAEQPLELYLTSAQVETDVYPFGGHYLLTVAPDGKVKSTRKFTNACVNMSVPRNDNTQVPAALMIGHLLDPLPTEIHVFLARMLEMPVYVGTSSSNRLWEVQGNGIRLVSLIDDKARRRSGSR